MKPEIAALVSYNRPFRLKDNTIFKNMKIYSAIKSLMDGKEVGWSYVLNARKDIDAIAQTFDSKKDKEQIYKLINIENR